MKAFVLLFVHFYYLLVGSSFGAFAEELVFVSPKILERSDDIRPQILGGVLAPDGEWPSTYVMKNGRKNCTSNLIGPRVILTARHCIGSNELRGKIFLSNNRKVNVECYIYNETALNLQADFALCKTAQSVLDLGLNGALFEVVARVPGGLRLNRNVTMAGFGCTNLTENDFGVLYQGTAQIRQRSGLNLVTVGAAGLCSGDSGGAAFMFIDRERSARAVVGVASRGRSPRHISVFALTHSPLFYAWARSWAARHGVKICGLHVDTEGCRN